MKKPCIVFEKEENQALLPLIGERFDVPQCDPSHKVHSDHHIWLNYATYYVHNKYIGKVVDVRVDSKLVRIYFKEKLIKIHLVKLLGGSSTDYDDYPKEKTLYVMQSCHSTYKKQMLLGPHAVNLPRSFFPVIPPGPG